MSALVLRTDFTALPSYMNDVQEVVRAFSPYIIIDAEAEGCISVVADITREGDMRMRIASSCAPAVEEICPAPHKGELEDKRIFKSFVKRKLYSYCNRLTGVSLPYGSLTGVRPTAVYYRAIGSHSNIIDYLTEEYDVEPLRAKLIADVVAGQAPVYNSEGEGVDVFVNIPICPTRCRYCSFISTEYARVRKLVPAYVEAVAEELEAIGDVIRRDDLKVRSVYFGGGTPTSLSAEELKRLVALASYGTEFTVEAGRPDSVTDEKMRALAAGGVTRVSVNPQTLKDETLAAIGRKHTTAQFFEAFRIARGYGFDINTDLIAGLENETPDDFKASLDGVIALSPENITVHSLSVKRGAALREEGVGKIADGRVKAMTEYAIATLKSAGYIPYYMYRQKNTADGLENVGYCKPGKQCIYNVDYMEETNTVLSAGAGAVTKYVYSREGRFERKSNAKGFEEYLRRAGKL